MFKTSPPSEVYNLHHDNTPVPSHLGEIVDDHYLWSNTIASN